METPEQIISLEAKIAELERKLSAQIAAFERLTKDYVEMYELYLECLGYVD